MKGLKLNNLVTVQNNKEYGLVTTSRMVAQGLGKRHSDVIESLERISENGDFRSLIIPTTYKVKGQKREYKEYLLTKDGFTLYMFNIQGYNDFKMAYINEFNRMERILNGEQLELEPYKIKNKTYMGIPCMTVKDLAFLCGYDRSSVSVYVRENSLGELLTYNKLKDFKSENANYDDVKRSLYVLYKEDVLDIVDYFRKLNECKEFLEEYFHENINFNDNLKTYLRVRDLYKFYKIMKDFNLEKCVSEDITEIISKEFVRYGLIDNPFRRLDVNSLEGWNLYGRLNELCRFE